MLEAGLVNLLITDATVSAIIGNRCYPVCVPETAVWPCLSYSVITSTCQYSLENSVITTKRIQLDGWSDSYLVAKQTIDAVRNVLSGFQGTLNDGTIITGAFEIMGMDLYEEYARKYRVLSEYEINFVAAFTPE